jgi:hypothetical protein
LVGLTARVGKDVTLTDAEADIGRAKEVNVTDAAIGARRAIIYRTERVTGVRAVSEDRATQIARVTISPIANIRVRDTDRAVLFNAWRHRLTCAQRALARLAAEDDARLPLLFAILSDRATALNTGLIGVIRVGVDHLIEDATELSLSATGVSLSGVTDCAAPTRFTHAPRVAGGAQTYTVTAGLSGESTGKINTERDPTEPQAGRAVKPAGLGLTTGYTLVRVEADTRRWDRLTREV